MRRLRIPRAATVLLAELLDERARVHLQRHLTRIDGHFERVDGHLPRVDRHFTWVNRLLAWVHHGRGLVHREPLEHAVPVHCRMRCSNVVTSRPRRRGGRSRYAVRTIAAAADTASASAALAPQLVGRMRRPRDAGRAHGRRSWRRARNVGPAALARRHARVHPRGRARVVVDVVHAALLVDQLLPPWRQRLARRQVPRRLPFIQLVVSDDTINRAAHVNRPRASRGSRRRSGPARPARAATRPRAPPCRLTRLLDRRHLYTRREARGEVATPRLLLLLLVVVRPLDSALWQVS